MDNNVGMAQRYEHEIPEGYEARIDGNKVILEPKESEDERIRKELIEYLTHRAEVTGFIDEDKDCKRWIAYLEKQKSVQYDTEKQYVRTLESLISDFLHGKQEVDRDYYQQICDWLEERHIEEKPESCDCSRDEESYTNGIHHVLMNPEAYGLMKQKPAEWSEEDEAAYNAFICEVINEKMNPTIEQIKWLRSVCYRLKSLRPQPKQEWSEEFLRLMGITISQDGNQVCVLLGENLAEGIAGFGDTLADAVEEFKKEWRQFDRFRKATWKPSEEQISALEHFIRSWGESGTMSPLNPTLCAAKTLLDDLKKL